MAGRHRKPPSRRGQGRHRRPPERRRLVAPALGTVVLLAAGGVAAAAAITGGGGAARTPDVVASTTTAPPAAVTPSPSPSPAASTPAAQPPSRPAPALAIKVIGRVSWLEVSRPGGHVIFSGMLRHGRDVLVRRGSAHVVIGDAGAVRLSRHGRVTSPAGSPGEVRVIDVH